MTPTENHANASVRYLGGDGDGVELDDFDSSTNGFQVELDVGDNVIQVEVTAEDTTTTKTYRVTVNREAHVCTAPDLSGRTEVWSGTITVGSTSSSYGYSEAGSDDFGELSDTDFGYGGNPYTIEAIVEYLGGDDFLDLDLDAFLSESDRANLRLHLCGDTFDLTTAFKVNSPKIYRWTGAVLNWTGATTIDAALSGTILNSDPTVANEIPDQTATAGTAYSYTFPANTFSDTDGDTLTYTAAQGDDSALPGWLTFAAGTRTFSGTPQASHVGTVTVKVTADDDEGGTVSDDFDLVVSAATTTAPAIVADGVQVTSTPMATGDTYGLGETIEITVTFDNAVTVDTSGGTPRIQFRLDGSVNKWADYSSGSGGTALEFTYTVQSGDMDDDGIFLPGNFLRLRSGTIRDATDDTVDATLAYPEPGIQTGHKVNGSLTTTTTCVAPTFTGRTEVWRGTITVGNDPFSYGYSEAGSDDFGELSDPDNFDYGGNNYTIKEISESFNTGSVNRLEFSLDVFLPNSDQANLRLHLCDDAYDLTAASKVNATKTYRWGGAVLDWSGETTIYAALSATILNSDPTVANEIPNQTATAGTAFGYTFPENTFSDTDGDTLTYTAAQGDDSALPGWLTFTAGTRTFSGTPQASHVGTVTVKVTADDGEGTVSDEFDLVVIAATPAPAIDSVQVTSTPATGDTYGLGETIEITVTFDTAVTVDTTGGTPRIQLRLGPPRVDKWADYSSGSGGTALVFTYIVQSGDMDGDGIWLPEDFLRLRTGTITAATDDTVDATLTYAEPGLQTGHKVNGSGSNTPATGEPSITGTARVGGTLTADTSGIGDADGLPATFNYRWVRVDASNNETDIGTNSSTYRPVAADVGDTIKVEVSFIDAAGNPEGPLESGATAAVRSANTGPLVLTVEAVNATVTEGEPVRYRIRMSRRTSGAVVESVFSYKGDFVRNPYSLVVSGINSKLAYDDGLSWVVSYDTVDDAVVEADGSSRSRSSART